MTIVSHYEMMNVDTRRRILTIVLEPKREE
jgi:hypothetical protein